MPDVVVIGGANVDIKARTDAPHRLSISNPGKVSFTHGGVGRNIAYNLARIGADVALISVVGDDAHGHEVLTSTGKAGVNVAGVLQSRGQTGTYLVVIDNDGELVSGVADMRVLEALTPEMVARSERLIADCRYVVADCNLRVDTLAAIAAIAGHKLAVEPVSVPKAEKLMTVLDSSSIFVATPNLHQVEAMTGTRAFTDAFARLHGKGLKNIVLHAGADGAFVSDGTTVDHVEADPATQVLDVTGGGDAAMAGLIYGLLEGHTLVDSVRLGQELAARVISSLSSTID